MNGSYPKLPAPADVKNPEFGSDVALSGNRLIVGARSADAAGSVFIYERDGWNWRLDARIPAPADSNGSYFGGAVALEGDRAIVGAWRASGSGVVFVYQRDDEGKWRRVAQLTPDASPNASFGRSLALRGNTLVVGAPDHARDGAAKAGAVFIYQLDDDGKQVRSPSKLEIGKKGTETHFGHAVAIDVVPDAKSNPVELVIVGAPLVDMDWKERVGRVFAYRGGGSAWTQVLDLEPEPVTNPDARFGHAVALAGGRLVVGAASALTRRFTGISSGAAYVYELAIDGRKVTHNLPRRLLPPQPQQGHGFGLTVAADEQWVLVGAPRANDDAGEVYRYRWDEHGPTSCTLLRACDPTPAAQYGNSLAIRGETAVVGAYGDGPGEVTGAVYTVDAPGRIVPLEPNIVYRAQGPGDVIAVLEVGGNPRVESGVGYAGKSSSDVEGRNENALRAFVRLHMRGWGSGTPGQGVHIDQASIQMRVREGEYFQIYLGNGVVKAMQLYGIF